MVELYRTLSLRYLRQRWSRAALIVASIALGVAMLVATRALSGSMTAAAQAAVNPLAGVADLQVTNGESGVPRSLVAELTAASVPGLRSAQPLVLGRVGLPDLDNRAALLLGVDLPADKPGDNPWGIEVRLTNPLALLSGRKPAFVGQGLADALPQGIASFRVRAAGKEEPVAGAGTLEAHGPAAALGGNVIVMRLADAAALRGRPDTLTRIDLVLAPGADVNAVRARVEEVLAGRAEVRTPDAGTRSLQDVMAGVELGFALNGAGALLVGLFLVYNALSVGVAERRHDIGILRSLGATRRQVAALFAGEAGLLGLAGASLGIPLGLVLAQAALGPIQSVLSEIFVPLENQRIEVSGLSLAGSAAAGVLTALLAALVPALQGATDEPADAVRRAPRTAGWRLWLLQAGVSGSVVGAGLGFVAFREALPRRAGTFGGIVLLFLGALLATPLLTSVAARVLRPAARRCLGLAGRLAADNLARSPGRTGLVVATLAAGLALILQTAGVIASSEDAVLDWVDATIGADLFVTSSSPVSSGGQSFPMTDAVGQKIASVPGVAAALPLRFRHLDFRDRTIFLIGLDAAGFYAAHRDRRVVDRELYGRLTEPGSALVSDNFAALYRVGAGDRITLRGPHGPVELHVLGTVLDYSWNRGVVFMDLNQYRAQFDDPLVDVFDVYVRPGAEPRTVQEDVLRRWGAEEALVVLTREELRQSISSMIHRLYGIAYAQELVVGLVATLGVITALLISVLQRRRELGLLRAVGASQGQVLRAVLAEATLMGLIGAVLGLLVGVPLEWYIVRILLFDEAGFLLPVRIPWTAAGLIVLLGVGVATLAGLGPALRAVRLRIPDAIAYE